MISPLVRRMRLAAELRRLRDRAGLSSGQLAARAKLNRQRISALENGHPFTNVADVAAVLTALELPQRTWHELFQVADDATKTGWWESYRDGLGSRQPTYVDLESGASTVHEYNLFVVPGVLQIPDYIRTRAELSALQWQMAGKGRFDMERAIRARSMRQQMLRRPGGPRYHAIIDELVIRRAAAPPAVMSAELTFLAGLSRDTDRTEVRVLPVDAGVGDLWLPRSPFSLYDYPDADDPTVAVVDTEMADYVFIERAEVRPYLELYERLEKVALSPEDTATFLTEQATRYRRESDRR